MKSFRLNLDALGMCASTLCMIHCLVFPLLLTALPMWRLSTSEAVAGSGVEPVSTDPEVSQAPTSSGDCCESECCVVSAEGSGSSDQTAGCCSTPTDFWIHVGLLATVAPLGMVAWGAGFRKHRQSGVLSLGLTGVLLLSGALLFGHQLMGGYGEQVMTVLGSICMVSAHMWNRRQCRCCQTPDPAGLVEVEFNSPSVRLVN